MDCHHGTGRAQHWHLAVTCRRPQAITWTNAGILLIRPLGTNLSEILIGVQKFSFKNVELNMSSANWSPFCLGLNELSIWRIKINPVRWCAVTDDDCFVQVGGCRAVAMTVLLLQCQQMNNVLYMLTTLQKYARVVEKFPVDGMSMA